MTWDRFVEFSPLTNARYDLVVSKEHFNSPQVTTMLKGFRSDRFQNEFKTIGGYDINDIGEIIAEA